MPRQSERPHDVAEQITARLFQSRDASIARSIGRIRSEIAFYRDTDVVSDKALRQTLEANLTFIMASLGRGSEPDLAVPQETGRSRAMLKVPLVDLLAAYRLSFTVLWDRVAEITAELDDVSNADLVDVAGRLFEMHERYAGAAADGYRAEAKELTQSSERERVVLLDMLLTGASAESIWQVAQSLGLPSTGSFVVVVASSPQPGQDPLPRAESTLDARDIASVWRLDARSSVGVLSLPAPTGSDAALHILGRLAVGPIGVSPVFTDLAQVAWGRRLAQLAVDSRPVVGVRQFPGGQLDTLLAAAPKTAVAVARSVLGPVIDLPGDDRDQLLETVQAWLESGGSATTAGAALFCHPNTVRYRLRRVEAFTGRSLTDPVQLAEIVTAVRAWNELPRDHRR